MEWPTGTEFVSRMTRTLGRSSRGISGRALEVTASHDEIGPVLHFASGHFPAVDPSAGVLSADRLPNLVIPSSRPAADQVSPAHLAPGLEDSAQTRNLNALRIDDQRNGIGVLEVNRACRITHDGAAAQPAEADHGDGAESEQT